MLPEDVTRKRLDGIPVPEGVPGPTLAALLAAWDRLALTARSAPTPEESARLAASTAKMQADRWRIIPILGLLLALALWATWR